MTKQAATPSNESTVQTAHLNAVEGIAGILTSTTAFKHSVVKLVLLFDTQAAKIHAVCTVFDDYVFAARAKYGAGAEGTKAMKAAQVYNCLASAGKTAANAMGLSGYFKSGKGKASGYMFQPYATGVPKASKSAPVADESTKGSTVAHATAENEVMQVAAAEGVKIECPSDILALGVKRFSRDAMVAAFVADFRAEVDKAIVDKAMELNRATKRTLK